jgi:hypothetical protein
MSLRGRVACPKRSAASALARVSAQHRSDTKPQPWPAARVCRLRVLIDKRPSRCVGRHPSVPGRPRRPRCPQCVARRACRAFAVCTLLAPAAMLGCRSMPATACLAACLVALLATQASAGAPGVRRVRATRRAYTPALRQATARGQAARRRRCSSLTLRVRAAPRPSAWLGARLRRTAGCTQTSRASRAPPTRSTTRS